MPTKKPTYQDLEKLIIELKSANKLRQSEDRFNMLLKASEDMITIHQPNGKYLYYNGPKRYEINSKDIVGKMPHDLFDKDVSTTLLKIFKKVAKTGNSETREVLFDWLGEKKWFSEYIYPIKDTDGKVIELVKICRDIHQRKIAEQEIEEYSKEKEKQAEELAIANKKLLFQIKEKRKRVEELVLADKQLLVQSKGIEKRADELVIANEELAFQNEEKVKRAEELVVADNELLIQNKEIEKRAEELVIANKELLFQNEEKVKRAEELVVADNELLIQNKEIEKRAEELVIANKELLFQNEEKVKRAEELVVADNELLIQNKEIEKRAEELVIANKELLFQNEEKEKRANELILANKELLFQNEEKVKRADELKISKQNIEISLELLAKRKYSMDEASKIAKMGYHEYDIATDTFIWSEYLYLIFGLDPKKRVPSRKKVVSFFDKKSKEKLTQATLELDYKGIPYDIELKLINQKDEEVWVRNVTQPVYNLQNKIIGRRGVTQDITDYKKGQLKLELSKLKIQTTLELVEKNEYSLKEAGRMAKVGYWGYDKQTDTIFWSEAVHKIYGTDPSKGVPEIEIILNVFSEVSRKKLIEATVTLSTIGVPFDIELQMVNLKNKKRWIRNIGEPMFNDRNEIIGRRGVSQDITEQKLIRNKIEKAEEMYRLLTDHSNDLICLHNLDSSFKYISPSITTLLGYEQSDLLNKKVFGIIHQEDIEPLKEIMKKRVFAGMFIDAFSCRVLHKEGHFVWLEFLSSPIYKEKKINYFVSSARDITQWVLAKQEIQEYQISLQKLTTEITLIEEKQKKEIASNIHDHLSQSLVISKMRVNELKKNPQLKIIYDDLKFIESHISDALENSRKITYELSPPVLYQLGIIEALNWLLEDIEDTHKIKCQLNSNITTIKLDDAKSILLYRSIQEVFTNAIKHAKASLITLNFKKSKLGIHIFIVDNGIGFDTSLLNNLHNHSGSGFGLFTVKERIRNIQGEFTITSNINVGTSIKIFIPLS
ncbi:PAS domain S-box protein [Polaribacter sp. IC073]|uniref:PAS domain S-box protein n=1 Tax=Polaribacter sp. IC073 TaxID=2508540 RepID=UPI0011BDA0C5|nr:PAS domain S-box protein [Polaribacter sp. IC073]TXD45868.1 PAS domain S-box protein [Polaribacter sp. IC073]